MLAGRESHPTPMFKHKPPDKPSMLDKLSIAEGVGFVIEALAYAGLMSGAAIAAALGQFVLAGIAVLLALGVFLRFKRLRKRR